MTPVEPMEPHEAFAELGRIRLADVTIDALLDRVAQLAKRAIPRASEVSVTLLHGNSPQTAAFTGELALALDEMQYERGHGPCLDAADSIAGLVVPDTSSEDRWPGWAAIAARPARTAPCRSACPGAGRRLGSAGRRARPLTLRLDG